MTCVWFNFNTIGHLGKTTFKNYPITFYERYKGKFKKNPVKYIEEKYIVKIDFYDRRLESDGDEYANNNNNNNNNNNKITKNTDINICQNQ